MSDHPTLQALADPEDEPHDPTATPASGAAACANCGAGLAGRYCADCGQLDQPLRQPVHRFMVQSFTEFFGLDGRVWKTLGHLLFKPGSLTQAYLGGRRRRYLRPLRVYLSSTLLFFFLLSVLDPVGQLEDAFVNQSEFADSTMQAGALVAHLDSTLARGPAAVVEQEALVDSLEARLGELTEVYRADSLAGAFVDENDINDALDPIEDLAEDLADERDDLLRLQGASSDRRITWQRDQAAAFPSDSLIRPQDLISASEILFPDASGIGAIELGVEGVDGLIARGRAYERFKAARTTEDRLAAGTDLARTAIGKIPVVLFLMLPVFALILKVIYVRRDWYYSEHLVFGLHTHAFAFVVFSMITGLAALGTDQIWTGILAVILYLWIPVYFLIAQRRVYGQGWIKTILKASVLGWTYLLVLTVFGLTLTLILAFLG